MSQQGGTYRIPSGASVAMRSDKSSQTSTHDDGKDDGQEWDVVTNPEADDETDLPAKRMSSHFDVQLGWGQWKFTLFSWDMNVWKPTRGTTRQP
ncbi:hypothetical protein FQN54_003312 [Arachnomyces sp. PD_36]|nr:hypothetical protein FQN54_003312 [Arachnomyces sp. PD_36]